jgi:iterative type I PKS product template protein
MEVSKPLVLKSHGASQTLQATLTTNLNSNIAEVRYTLVDSSGKYLDHHANCTVTFEDKTSWSDEWASSSYLIHSRIDSLKDKVSRGEADQISRKMAYKLFASLVLYDDKYQGMQEVTFDSANFEATARVAFQTSEEDGSFLVNPYWIDSVGHISGFIVNGSDATDSKNFVYISHGWSAMRLIKPLQRNTIYTTHVKMHPAPKNIMVGDVHILEGQDVVGVWKGIKFQQIPRKVLNTFLPPNTTTSGTSKAVSIPSDTIMIRSRTLPVSIPEVVAPVQKQATSIPVASVYPNPVSGYVETIMEIIAEESSIPRDELVDLSEWTSLGVDSLLSLQIAGRLRETLDIDLPSSIFLKEATVGEFKQYLSTSLGAKSTSSSSSEPGNLDDSRSNTSVESVADEEEAVIKREVVSTYQNNDNALEKIRHAISEQMNIPLEELTDSVDLVSLGADSLMSICILGALRETMDLNLPSTLFQDCPTIEAIGLSLGLYPPTVAVKPAKALHSTRNYRATSVLLQGTRSASKKLFLFPDGSGSATSYTNIPALDPSIAIYGLNSPFMTCPAEFTTGIPGIASIYLAELQRRQPHGPYYLGGWSAGGIVAYEVVQQLLAMQQETRVLVLFDSPCPINLAALPSRLHDFFAEIGLLGDGKNVPDWLIPHFSASIRALSEYNPVPLPKGTKMPKTLAVWARHGVCRYPGRDPRPARTPDEPWSMTWLLDNRQDFGTNGWERLFGSENVIETTAVDGNHFDMMRKGDQVYLPMFSKARTFANYTCSYTRLLIPFVRFYVYSRRF